MAKGSQVVTGTEGDDFIKVNGKSDDEISGLGGNDVISAGAGMDHVDGGDGDDTIDGGAHNDTIDGGAGNDVLTGGAHADTFIFGAGSGIDTVTDFRSGEDTVDLSGAGITDLTGRVTDDANGNAVIDLGGGNSVTLLNISAADFLADASNYILATGPQFVQLGIDDTYTDAGDFSDQIIDGDNQGEEDTDTDTFIFGPGTGQDTITDFRYEDFEIDENGIPVTIEGDTLDLSAYGIYGDDLTDAGFPAYLDSLIAQGLLDSWSVTPPEDATQQTVLTFPDGSSLTLLGIGENEIGTVIEANMVRDTGGAV